jgi:hypothetical protein
MELCDSTRRLLPRLVAGDRRRGGGRYHAAIEQSGLQRMRPAAGAGDLVFAFDLPLNPALVRREMYSPQRLDLDSRAVND